MSRERAGVPPGASGAAHLALLAVFVGLVAWRMPGVFAGRFWAEEGVVYFADAWNRPWYDAWFAIHTGYLNLAAGLATWAGLMIGGVEQAPRVTVIIALALQCLPPLAIITHDYPWRRSLPLTAAAVLLCAVPPLMGEVWLNTITSQFHLGLFAALVLAAPPAEGGWFAFDCLGLSLAAFSGPATSFLMPLFLLKAILSRDRRTFILALIVLCGFCAQSGIYLAHIMPERGHRLGLGALLSLISLHTIVLQFGGPGIALRFATRLGAAHAAHRPLLLGPTIFCGFYGLCARGVWRARCAPLAWLLAAAAATAILSFGEGLDGTFAVFIGTSGGQRYAFIPLVLNGLVVVGLAGALRGVVRAVCVAATIWLLLVGFAAVRRDVALFASGPAWAPQVAIWRAHPAALLAVWPGPPWYFTLPRK